MLDMAIPANGL